MALLLLLLLFIKWPRVGAYSFYELYYRVSPVFIDVNGMFSFSFRIEWVLFSSLLEYSRLAFDLILEPKYNNKLYYGLGLIQGK